MDRPAKTRGFGPSTFSIAAYDQKARQWGVAVQSKFLAVGSVVPWAEAGAGAVATQAAANTRFGPEGLSLLRQGLNAQAALLIVQEKGGYGDHLIDLRVDDHLQPIAELARLLELHQLYFGATEQMLTLKDQPTVRQIQTMLKALGHYAGEPTGRLDAITLKAIEDFHNIENLEMRRTGRPDQIDVAVLIFMRERYQAQRNAS